LDEERVEVEGVAATTHWDRQGERITKGCLESMAAQINQRPVPILFSHDPGTPPIGAQVRAEVRPMDDGEWGLYVTGHVYKNHRGSLASGSLLSAWGAVSEADVARLTTEMRRRDVEPRRLLHISPSKGATDRLITLADEATAAIRETLASMTPEEILSVQDALPPFWGEYIDWGAPNSVDDPCLADMARVLLVALVDQRFWSLRAALGLTWASDAPVVSEYPELLELVDADGLIVPPGNMVMDREGVIYGDHLIRYSPFLRRYYRGAANTYFLAELARFRTENPACTVAVALDPTRLIRRDEWLRHAEKDHWEGPRFSLEGLDDPNAIGLTIKGRADPFEGQVPIERTEFLWTSCGAEKTLQVEEVMPARSHIFDGSSHIVVRYAHSIRNTKSSRFIHLDGAVRAWRREDYEARRTSRLPAVPKTSHYVKTFRVDAPEDGEIPLEAWMRLLNCYFRDNELVQEYLAGE
jgi:hypothetical protein